jgi:hypothetical protein
MRTFPPGTEIDPTEECEEWLARWSHAAGERHRDELATSTVAASRDLCAMAHLPRAPVEFRHVTTLEATGP